MRQFALIWMLMLVAFVAPARADYTLVCDAGGGRLSDVTVRGANGFADACARMAQDPAYSRYSRCTDTIGRGGACPLRGGATPAAAVWNRSAFVPSSSNKGGTYQNGNTWTEQIANGGYTYTEKTADGRASCVITVTFDAPPDQLRVGGAPVRNLTAHLTVTATPAPPGTYRGYSPIAKYLSTLERRSGAAGIVLWEGDQNPGVPSEDSPVVGCNNNDAKTGRSVWSIVMPDTTTPNQFEFQTRVGTGVLVGRYIYLRQ